MKKLSLTVKMMTSREVQRMWMCTGRSGRFRGNELKETFSLATKKKCWKKRGWLNNLLYGSEYCSEWLIWASSAYLFHLWRLFAGDPIYPCCLCCPHLSCPSLEQLPFLQFPFPFLSSYAPSHSTWRFSPGTRAPFPLFPFAQPPHALRALQQNDMLHLITVYNVHVNILMQIIMIIIILIIIIIQYIADSAKVALGIGN